MVGVNASVIDSRGDFVAGLKKENFRIRDNGAESPVTFFEPVEAPAQVFVLVETSPAVYLIRSQHLIASAFLFDGLARNDQVAIATYSRSIQLVLPMTSDRAALSRALGRLQFSQGMAELNLYSSVSAAVDSLSSLPGKKSLVLLTTGLDSGPPESWQNLAAKLRGSDTTIFVVALGGELRGSKPGKKSKAARNPPGTNFEASDQKLRELASITGGRMYLPEDASDFPSIYQQIVMILRHQYVLGFSPASHDGRFHIIQLQVLDENGRVLAPSAKKTGYQVFARPGYQSPFP